MAVGRGWGGASARVPTTPCWLAPAPPLLIQGGEFCLALTSLCLGVGCGAGKRTLEFLHSPWVLQFVPPCSRGDADVVVTPFSINKQKFIAIKNQSTGILQSILCGISCENL